MTDQRLTTEPAAPGQPEQPGPRLFRSRRHKVIGGVCGGVGRYYNLDPVIFRVPLAVLSVIDGLGFVAYGIAWLLIPFEREEQNEGRRLLSGRVEGPGLTALLFIVIGFGLLLASVGNRSAAFWFSVMVLGALGGAARWSRRRAETQVARAVGAPVDTATEQVVAEAPPEAQAPPVPAGPTWWRDPRAGAGAPAGGGYLWGPADASRGDHRMAPGHPPPGAGGVWTPREAGPPPPPAEPREFRLGGLVLLLALVACLLGTGLAWDRQPLGVALVIGLSAALMVFGAGLVVSAFAGRLGGGTVLAVVLTGVLLAGAAALPDTITTSWSSPEWRPARASEVQARYEVGSGDATLDLSALDLEGGRTISTGVIAGAGEVVVRVPRDARVTVHTEIGAGAFDYQSGTSEGWAGVEDSWSGIDRERTATYPPSPGTEEAGGIDLRLEMGIGHVVVERR